MSDVSVKPTSIQRNRFDVATELTQLHFSRFAVEDNDHIEKVFSRYYALAYYCDVNSLENLQHLLSDELLQKVGKRNY